MRVCVAICTWNRSALLDRTLAAMHALRIPEGVEWDLLVINNNCTDDTEDVIARHVPHLPLRHILEPRQGTSHARNRAVDEVTGELTLWTDDDVLVDREWMAAYVDAAARWPDAVFFGGSIAPWFETDPPAWIERLFPRLHSPYVIFDRDEIGTRPMAPDESPVCANAAFRTGILKQFRFDARFGKTGSSSVTGEETDLVGRMKEAGHGGVWVGDAKVSHYISRSRLTERYIYDWYRWHARTNTRTDGLPECRCLRDVPLWALRQYWESRLKSWCLSPFKGPRWLSEFTRAAYAQGCIEEFREQRRRWA
jgi:glycosyltransferase involved in cell wall biosynthesis